ncbi:hypothetical protein, partial [Massilia sp. Leaf139]|uniref:hypothetical protein n=1 Tax=Massilia sp. Leaf139 TaxID=1736272 RepID=UPI000B333025
RVTHEYANGVSIINAWVNGVQTVFGTVINGTLIDAPTTPMTIGNRAADMARSWDGLIFYTLVWNRITPGEEVAVFDPAALERTPEPMLGNGASGVIADTALAGAAALRATAGGSLTTKIALSGAAGIQASAGGSLVTEIRLSGSAGVQATAAGVLTTSIALAGAAGQQSAASGSLLTGIALAGAAAARATASGSLDGGAAGLIGAAVARVSASGDLSTAISLAGAAALQSSASGTLAGSGVSLSGVAAGRSSVLGELSTAISLAGLAPARVSAAGVLATRVALSGSARLVASGVGNLGVGVSFTRAPAGPGYAPRRGEYQARPAQTGGRRPPAFEKAYR